MAIFIKRTDKGELRLSRGDYKFDCKTDPLKFPTSSVLDRSIVKIRPLEQKSIHLRKKSLLCLVTATLRKKVLRILLYEKKRLSRKS